MIDIHFTKLLVELIFIHRTAGKMKSLNRLLWQCAFYWGGLFAVGYSVFHPMYKTSIFFADMNGD